MKSFFILLFLFPLLSFAQKEDRVWVFQDSICIDFNNLSAPVVSHIALNSYNSNGENNASIANDSGSLVFYTGPSVNVIISSCEIRGANSQVIPNGDSIVSGMSMTQGLLYIPFVSDSSKYYLFYINLMSPPFLQTKGLYCAIIDKTLNGGFGSCVQKNQLILLDTLCEKLTAIKHGNGSDWWLITHKLHSNKFYKFLI